ncbi:MAG: T9SS type A sorting domain-containing protein [Balneolales bacterium]|nr:T9SS type A sorting domain-containing protein [Balneolales bacterium]
MIKATKCLLVLVSLFIGAGSTLMAQDVTPITEARDLDLGTTVTVEGILTSPDYNFFNNQFFIQDSSAGISIFLDGDNSTGTNSDGDSPFASGDSIRVTGTLIDTNGLLEIETDSMSYTIINSGNTIPAPVAITPEDLTLDSDYQGMRVLINPVSLADGETWPADAQTSSGVNVDVVSGDSTFTLRIDRDESFYDGAPAPGPNFALVGNLGAFFSPQIFPFYEGDVTNSYAIDFTINTSTLPDTLREQDFIQLRGAVNGNGGTYLGKSIDWNSGSELVAENVGGDYWNLSFYLLEGDNLIYKVWSGFDENTGTNNGDGGWEVVSANRELSVASDTTVLIYSDSDNPPFESDPDSVTLMFRVNVGAFVQDFSFDPTTDKVGVRGSTDLFDNPADWSASAFYLDQQGSSSDNLFYAGTLKVDNEAADTLGSLPYKFVLETEGGSVFWDNLPGSPDGNRFLDIPTQDSTIRWVNFQEVAPTAATIVTADVTFEVNVAVLEILGYFDSGIGDEIVVRGEPPLDWGTSESNTATFDDEDVRWTLTQEYTKAIDTQFKYKYFIEYHESRTDETSENYIEAIDENEDFGYEEPATTGGADRLFDFIDATAQGTGLQYFNDISTGGIITAENTPNGTMSVTFEIDMSPALEADVPFDPTSDSLYLQLESKFTALINGYRSGGGFFEDVSANGTAEDIESLRFTAVEGETNIYSLTLDLVLPTINDFGYVVRYGKPFSDYEGMVTNGDGFAAGRRYYQFATPTSVVFQGEDPFLGEVYNSSWSETNQFQRVTWAPDDLEYEIQPDYPSLVGTSNEDEGVNPELFSLHQNYPNPFNPTTNIGFTLPNAANVTLTVYNVLGQEVASILDGKTMTSGTHTVAFDARALASGMYIYRIEAGNFVSTKRMMLIK